MAFLMANIKGVFSKCGIFPFNCNAVDTTKMLPYTVYQGASSDDWWGGGEASSAQQAVDDDSHDVHSTHDVSNVPSPDTSNVPSTNDTSFNSPSFTPPMFNTPSVSDTSNVPSTDDTSFNSPSFTPSMFNTPSVPGASSSRCTTPVVNPLVKAGLVPSNLANILTPADPDTQPKRWIVKARVLTEDEFMRL